MSDDKQLKQAVLDELRWEPSVNAAHIGVTTNNGVVTLMGHVESYFEKTQAEKAVQRVAGVKGLAEEIEVRLPFSAKRGDEEIASAAVSRLAWDGAVVSDAVEVKVENGWITLTGQVDWHYQQESAADDVRGLRGVIGVTNQIAVKPRPNVGDIRANILAALHRSWIDPTTITVTAQDGKVKLAGTVDSWSERDLAGTTAWAAPGTTFVENNIRVD